MQTDALIDVSGEWVRKDVRDNEKGVDLHMDIQIIGMSPKLRLEELEY
jgi:hypothetical protein